jgi:hypothetical protein
LANLPATLKSTCRQFSPGEQHREKKKQRRRERVALLVPITFTLFILVGPAAGVLAFTYWPYWWMKILAAIPLVVWLVAITVDAIFDKRPAGAKTPSEYIP